VGIETVVVFVAIVMSEDDEPNSLDFLSRMQAKNHIHSLNSFLIYDPTKSYYSDHATNNCAN
jgi:hypothetical protein